jgi:hypothetical protein
MTTFTQTARNTTLQDAVPMLEAQHAAKYDVVTSSELLRYTNGDLEVVDENGAYYLQPNAVFEDGVSARLDVPRQYLRRMRDDAAEHGDFGLLDNTFNHWMHRSERNWFVRGFKFDGPGIARALLSDRYNCIDHIDAVFATLDGVAAAGVRDVQVSAVDLSEKKLRVKITSPSIRAAVPQFLRSYRSPFNNRAGDDLPLIEAGIVMTNSETGGGAFQISPHVTVLVCNNGMTRSMDALRKVHLGERMTEGVIAWSAQTRHAGIDLIKSQTADAVTTFLSQTYLDAVADELEEASGHVLTKPVDTIEIVGKQLKYGEEERASILNLFMQSGDPTSAGVVQAVTAYAQTLDNSDRAAELEDSAFQVLALASAQPGNPRAWTL